MAFDFPTGIWISKYMMKSVCIFIAEVYENQKQSKNPHADII